MLKLRRFFRYLSECYLKAGDGVDKSMKGLTGVLFVGLALCRWISPHAPVIAYLNNTEFSDFFERGFIIVAVVWGLIWMPFKHNENLREEYEKDLLGKESQLKIKTSEYEEALRPKFKISCDMESSMCSFTTKDESVRILRIVVKTDCGQQGIDKCAGHITRIEKNKVVIRDDMMAVLPFAPSSGKATDGKTLLAGIPHPLDVLIVQGNSNPPQVLFPGFRVSLPLNARGEPGFKEAGDYILTVVVSGAGATATEKLRFKWTGAVRDSELSLVNQ